MNKRAFKLIILTTAFTSVIWAMILINPGLVFYPAGSLLYRDDQPRPGADLILVLMGEPEIRPAAGADAVKRGFAPRLMMITPQRSPLEEAGFIPSEDKIAMESIRRTGLPLSSVFVIDNFGLATSTMDEAVAFKKWVSNFNPQVKRVIVVTSWPHSSRAAWAFHKVLGTEGPTIEMMPINAVPFTREDWWKSERGMLFVFEEYMKYGRYLIKYAGQTP